MTNLKSLNKTTAPTCIMPERIIQFGEGNFLRAFVDWMVNRMNAQTPFNGSVVIVQPRERNHLEPLRAQDGLYHVNLVGLQDGRKVNTLERITCVSRALNPYTQNEAFMALAQERSIRFVISNTTEAGIAFDPSSQLHDAPAASFPGKLTQLLYRRYQTFHGMPQSGLIMLPCELIMDNGRHLHDCVDRYIDLWKADLGADYDGFKTWVDTYCSFCTTLVDRIVNGYPTEQADALCRRAGYRDRLLVQGECFHLWVIEHDKNLPAAQLAEEFPAAQAGLNVLITDNEKPYHTRKVTLLNGPHTVLSPVAWLSGINIVRDACQHPVVGRYVHKVQFDELMQTLDLPHEECEQFARDVLERFENPFIDHQLTSIMLNSFAKYEARDLPGVKIYLKRKGCLPKGLVFGLAAIVTYYQGGVREDGTKANPSDDSSVISHVQQLWATADVAKVAHGVLAMDNVWHENLNDTVPGITSLLAHDLEQIQHEGMLNAVEALLQEG